MGELAIGTVVGGVRIDAESGRGGMGVVYRGTQLALNRTVALKLVRNDLADNVEFRERFTRESQIAASLDHPHIVPIYSAGEDEGRLYVAMRYVDGIDLAKLIGGKGALDPRLAAELVNQIGSALDAAHRRGLVHRDVKPANILLTTNEGRPHAYLTDFGLTRMAAAGGGPTRTGMVMGTIDYMAPEQIEGAPLDGRADVYALGCVLYQALSGRVPFPRETEPAKLWAHLSQPPPHLSASTPRLPFALDEVLQRAMAKRPVDRLSSAGELGRSAVAAVGSGRVAGDPRTDLPPGADQRRPRPPSPPAGYAPTSASGGHGSAGYAPMSASGGHRSAGRSTPVGPASWRAPAGHSGPLAGSGPYPHLAASAGSGPPATAAPRRSRRRLLLGIGAAAVIVAAVAAALILQLRTGPPVPEQPVVTVAGTVVGTPIQVGKEPYSIERGAGFLWTANVSDGTISKIDPATSTSQQIMVGGAPAGLVVDQGGVWVWNYSDGVTRVDVATGQVGEPIVIANAQISAIAAGGGFVWLSNTADDTVIRLSMATEAVEGVPIKVGTEPTSLAYGNDNLYVANSGDGTLTSVYGPTGAVVGPPLKLEGALGGIGVLDGVIYAFTGDGVTRIDERSFIVSEPVPLKGGSLFVPDIDGAWVVFPLENQVRLIDFTGAETRGTPIVGVGKGIGSGLVVDGELWLTNSADSTVIRIRRGS